MEDTGTKDTRVRCGTLEGRETGTTRNRKFNREEESAQVMLGGV